MNKRCRYALVALLVIVFIAIPVYYNINSTYGNFNQSCGCINDTVVDTVTRIIVVKETIGVYNVSVEDRGGRYNLPDHKIIKKSKNKIKVRERREIDIFDDTLPVLYD